MQTYVEWTPKYDGHKPPHWRDDMLCTNQKRWHHAEKHWHPSWCMGLKYLVDRAAVHPDATALIAELRKLPADELAKHGVTMEPERDWAVELFARSYAICMDSNHVSYCFDAHDLTAIEYIRNNARPLA